MNRGASARPLGVRADVSLTADQARTLLVLQEYDLALVRDRLLREGAMPAAWLDEAIYEFRRYLSLRVLCGFLPAGIRCVRTPRPGHQRGLGPCGPLARVRRPVRAVLRPAGPAVADGA